MTKQKRKLIQKYRRYSLPEIKKYIQFMDEVNSEREPISSEPHTVTPPIAPGDWFYLNYGGDWGQWCVKHIFGDLLVLHKKKKYLWTITIREPSMSREYQAVYIGKGKEKKYWKYLPWKDLVCKYKTPRNYKVT